MSMIITTYIISGVYSGYAGIMGVKSFDHELSIFNRHFLPERRADITVSASLQRICGGIPPTRPNPLHPLRLASTAISIRE